MQRICQKFVLTRNVVAERAGRPVGTTTPRHEEFIVMEAILKEPATRLHQLASTIQEQSGSEFDVSTLCRALHRLGFTNKKISIKTTDTANLISQLSNTYYWFWLSTDKRNCSPEKRWSTCSIQSWYAKSFASWTHFYWWDRNCKCCFFYNFLKSIFG